LRAFQGIIDFHTHVDLDTTQRSLDVFEMCRLFRDRGFCGVLRMAPTNPARLLGLD
jgi:hypothetical protein